MSPGTLSRLSWWCHLRGVKTRTDSPSDEGQTDTRMDIHGATPDKTGQSPALINIKKTELRDYRDVLRCPSEDTKVGVGAKIKTKGKNKNENELGLENSGKKSAKVAENKDENKAEPNKLDKWLRLGARPKTVNVAKSELSSERERESGVLAVAEVVVEAKSEPVGESDKLAKKTSAECRLRPKLINKRDKMNTETKAEAEILEDKSNSKISAKGRYKAKSGNESDELNKSPKVKYRPKLKSKALHEVSQPPTPKPTCRKMSVRDMISWIEGNKNPNSNK